MSSKATTRVIPYPGFSLILTGHLGRDEDRFAAARAYLATQGWHIGPGYDGCPDCPRGGVR